MTPPRDPMLWAVWWVGRAADLTPTERLALLALWRYLGSERKPIGPGLLAALTGVERDYARILLQRLRRKGYIDGHGQRTGKAATRWLTAKVRWPAGKHKVGTGAPTPRAKGVGTGAPQMVGTGAPHDLGVRQAACLTAGADTLPENDGPPVNLADYLCGGRKR